MEINLCTTVPQNLNNKMLASRHKPTRNSLRHSRMIVLNRINGGASAKNPEEFLGRKLQIISYVQLLLGLLIGALVIGLMVSLPNVSLYPLPFFSWIPLICGGICGRMYQSGFPRPQSFQRSVVKFLSSLFSIISIVLCLITIVFLYPELLRTSRSTCSKIDLPQTAHNNLTTCQCIYDHQETTTFEFEWCENLKCIIGGVYGLMIWLNAIACPLSLLFLLWSQRNEKHHIHFSKLSTVVHSSTSTSAPSKGLTTKEKEKYVEGFAFEFCQESTKYEIVAKIGQGTFGEVFKAKDRSNPKKFVAMKKVLMDNEKEGFPITALREIRILQLLKHDNVVNLIEICRTKPGQNNKYRSTLYLVFEFCEHDLAGLLSNASVKFSLGEIKKVMQQLLNGLYYIHSNKILHRDMKSANVLLTKNGVLKLADFGLARAFSNKTQNNRYTNRVVTLWYRPPELLLGERNYGPPVDLWGAGCIMAEMWTRSPIMQGNTEQQQLTLISQLCGSITPEVWPNVESLEFYPKIELPQNQKRKVRERLEPYMKNPYACDLLDKLLTLDPAQRFDSDSALNHDFFWTDPMPMDLSHMMSQLSQSMFEYLVPPRRVGNTRGQHAFGNGQRNLTLQEGEYHDRVF